MPFYDRIFVAAQRLAPARLICRAIYAISRSRNRQLKNALIRGFVWLYQVDLSEAELPVPDGYPNFNAFFTRALKPGARPPDADPAAVVSPADGAVQQHGTIEGGRLLQVKGIDYGLDELFGADERAVLRYAGGAFITIYLAPWNYHRVHMPLAGAIRSMRYVPGSLWSVNPATARRVPGLLARNERLICHCAAPWGEFAVVLVGALNVSSISTVWAGEVLPGLRRRATTWDYGAHPPQLERGALLGQFNLGSTVIVVLPPNCVTWDPAICAGRPVRVGQRLGRCLPMCART